MKRVTNAEKAKDSNIPPLLLNEQEAAKCLSLTAGTLRNWRAKTPKYWTVERMEAAAARGEVVYPPFRKIGDSIRYEWEALRRWIKLAPEMGRLPEEVTG